MALITQDFIVRSGLVVQGTADVSTSTNNSGALQVNSGAGIAGSLVVGSTASIYGPTILNNTLQANGAATFAGAGTGLTVSNNALVSGLFTVTNASTFNQVTIGGLLTANGASLFNNSVFVTGTNILTVGTGAVNFGGTLGVAGVTSITNSTTAATGGTGALVVTGGTVIGDNLIVKSTASSSVNTNSNSIYTLGGLGVSKDLSVGGSAVITGNLTVLGTQTIFNSTSTAIQDPVIDIGTNPNDAPLIQNDGYNKGIVLHYYDTADNHMFLGRNNTTGHLVLRNNIDSGASGVIPNADYINNGNYATFDLGTLIANDTTNATNTTSGALQVAGGAGIGGNVYIGGNLTAATLTGKNLSANQLAYANASGELVTSSALTFNTTTNTLVAKVTTATNIAGGTVGAIPYQSAAGVTSFVSIGTNGYVLTSNGTNPYWASASSTSVGNADQANYANNLNGGAANYIPYQSATSSTTFDSHFTYDGSTLRTNGLKINDAYTFPTADGSNGYVLQTDGSGNVSWADLAISLSADSGSGNIDISAGDGLSITGGTGISVSVSGTSYSISSTYSNTDSLQTVTNRGSTTTNAIKVGGLTDTALTHNGGVVYNSGSGTLADSSGLTYDGSGALTVGTSITITGSGNLALGGGNITGANNITATGTVQAGFVKPTNLTSGRVTYYNGTSLVDNSGFTFDGTTLTAPKAVISNTTNATASTGSGALQVAGGAGIAKDLWIGGDLNVDGTIYLKGVGLDTVSASTGTFVDVNVTGSGTALNVTNNAVVGGTLTATNLVVTGNFSYTGTTSLTNLSATNFTATNITATNLVVNGTSILGTATVTSLYDNGNATIGANLLVSGISTFTGAITVLDTTQSSSTTSGSITTAGGVGVAKNITAGGTVTASGAIKTLDTTQSSSTSSGSIVASGGLGVALNATIGGTITNLDATNSTSTSSGSIVTAGGIGAAKNIVAGGTITTLDTTNSTSTLTGALVIGGGIGVGKNVNVGGTLTVGPTAASSVVPALYSNNILLASYTSPTITGTTTANLDTFSSTTYRTARYVVQIVDGSNIHVTEILLFHDGTDVYINEYGTSYNNGLRGSFSATLSSNTITLTFTPSPSATAMTIKVVRMGITA